MQISLEVPVRTAQMKRVLVDLNYLDQEVFALALKSRVKDMADILPTQEGVSFLLKNNQGYFLVPYHKITGLTITYHTKSKNSLKTPQALP